MHIKGFEGNYKFSNCVFQDNRAYLGGALWVEDMIDTLHIENSLFRNNTATLHGGAIYITSQSTLFKDQTTSKKML